MTDRPAYVDEHARSLHRGEAGQLHADDVRAGGQIGREELAPGVRDELARALEHVAHLVRPNEWYAALVNLLLLTDGARTLVFVRRRVDTTELAERLAGDGFVALPLSGDLAQGQRTRTLNAFRNGFKPGLESLWRLPSSQPGNGR